MHARTCSKSRWVIPDKGFVVGRYHSVSSSCPKPGPPAHTHITTRSPTHLLHLSRIGTAHAQHPEQQSRAQRRFPAHGDAAGRVSQLSWRARECSGSTLGSDTTVNKFGADARHSLQRDFKDAELYLIRYQQCMTRSMTLIKIYFVNTIKSLGLEVGAKLAQRVRQFKATRPPESRLGYASCRADRRRTSRTPPPTLCCTPSSLH